MFRPYCVQHLLWRAEVQRTSLEKTDTFPTWSWASSPGKIDFLSTLGAKTSLLRDLQPFPSAEEQCNSLNPANKALRFTAPLVKLSDLESSFVINGTVTILCGVIVVPDIDNTLPVPPQPELASHLGHILDSALGTDVSFDVMWIAMEDRVQRFIVCTRQCLDLRLCTEVAIAELLCHVAYTANTPCTKQPVLSNEPCFFICFE